MTQGRSVSIGALMASGVSLRPHEAVAVVVELCSQLGRPRRTPGVMPAISASTVTLDASGAVAVNGGAPGEDEQTVSLVGHLLLDMLDHSALTVEAPAPPKVRTTAVRAAFGGRKAFGSAAQFVSALRRHGPESDRAEVLRGVFDRWMARHDPLVPASRPAAPATARPGIAMALLVGATLLVLAGAGFVFLARGPVEDLPLVVPAVKPTPVQPKRQPGWELLKRSERAAASSAPRTVPARRAGSGEMRELANPPQAEPPTAVRQP
jgi:hypothetical protein